MRNRYLVIKIDGFVEWPEIFFLFVDANAGLCQVEIDEWYTTKTSIVINDTLYIHTQMPFCLENASALFQSAMEVILELGQWQTAVLFVDNIRVSWNNSEHHIHHLDLVLWLPSEPETTSKQEKRFFLFDKVKYERNRISASQLEVASKDVRSEWSTVELDGRDRNQVHLAFLHIYHRFVSDMAKFAGFLRKDCRKWTRASRAA